jgi:hypothetical protein
MNASTPLTRLPTAAAARFSATVPRAATIFSAVCAIVLVATLFTGATTLFNVVVSVLFIGLWLAFAAAILISPSTLDEEWQRIRRLPLAAELVIWKAEAAD